MEDRLENQEKKKETSLPRSVVFPKDPYLETRPSSEQETDDLMEKTTREVQQLPKVQKERSGFGGEEMGGGELLGQRGSHFFILNIFLSLIFLGFPSLLVFVYFCLSQSTRDQANIRRF